MNIQPNSLAVVIKQVRRQLNLTQEELAHELGVSFSTINRWENGQTKPIKIALKQFTNYCEQQEEQGKLDLKDFLL
jgi:putative transcriptional regulator